MFEHENQEIKSKSIPLSYIETPRNVEEFRDHLRRYFLGDGLCLLSVRDDHGFHSIPYDEISSLSDLHSRFNTPAIVPFIHGDMADLSEIDCELNLLSSVHICDRFTLKNARISSLDLYWSKIDNKHYTEIFTHLLGWYNSRSYGSDKVLAYRPLLTY